MAIDPQSHVSVQVFPLGQEPRPVDQASFRLQESDSFAVVIASGEIDLSTSPSLRSMLAAAAESSDRVLVDMTAVTFLDSTGLGVLAAAQMSGRAAGRSVVLFGGTGMVKEVLHITRLDLALPMYASLADALAHADGVRGNDA
jgi:anti-sigma B factor antagonist